MTTAFGRAQPTGSGSVSAPGPSPQGLDDAASMDFMDEVLAALDVNGIGEACSVFQYDGFNAAAFRLLLGKRLFIAANGNKETARKMMQEIIAIIVERGSKVKKKGDLKMTPEATRRFNSLVTSLTVQGFSQDDKGTKPSQTVTLARIAVVLVFEVGQVLTRFPSKVKVPTDLLPPGLCMPGAASMVPTDIGENHPLLVAIYNWNLAFARLVGQPDNEDTKQNVAKFMRIAQNGNLYTNQERVVRLGRLRALDTSGFKWAPLMGAELDASTK